MLVVILNIKYYIWRRGKMANHGTLTEDDMQEDWSEYIERLEFYFEANGVSDGEKQRAILLSVCGSKTYV